MICPRCGNEWDATRSPCTRCGLVIWIPNSSGLTGRATPPPPSQQKPNLQQSGGGSPLRPTSNIQPGSPMPNRSPSATTMPIPGSPGASQFPSPAQVPYTPRPLNLAVGQVPETPRVSPPTTPLTGFDRPGAINRASPRVQQTNSSQSPMQTSAPRTDALSPRGVPPRPHNVSAPGRPTEALGTDVQRPQSMPRASRLVTDPLAGDAQGVQGPMPSILPRNAASPMQSASKTYEDTRQLMPGAILRGGRYRLHEMQGRQEWLSGASESMWIAQDAQRGASQVMICELVLPEIGSMVVQSILRTATMALTSIGRHPHIPTLWDAFSDRGRSFFVFEPVDGESLMSRMRRTGRAMQEQDVIECCLQMAEVLELLAQQSPPLVHGLISPEHIMVTRTGSQYVLTNFSLVLAGGATQFVSGIDRTRLSAYTAPEFVRGVIDVRSDLFSLIAAAYHCVTGSMPASVSGSVPPAQRINPNVSQQFDAILSKGLRPIASQRYQRPSELRQELLSMRSVSGSLLPGSGQQYQPSVTTRPVSKEKQRIESAPQAMPDSVAQAFQSLAPAEDIEEQSMLLPRPEELPPMEKGNDKAQAAIWLCAIVVSLVLIIFLTRGFF